MQIKPDDAVLALNGIDITSATQIQALVANGPITSSKVLRGGAIITLRAPLTI